MGVNTVQKNNKKGISPNVREARVITRDQWSTPGAMLRAARVKKSLRPEDVCKELGLTLSYLSALENDDYKTLRAPVYVRGYIRRYCDILGISSNEMLSSYEHIRQQAASGEKGSADGSTRQSASSSIGKSYFYKSMLSRLKVNNWTFPLGLCAFAVLAVLLASATGSSRLVAEEITIAAAESNAAMLEITLDRQAWVEVTDARGDILAADLKPAGARLALSGTPPFQLKLGSTEGVNVTYQQQPIHLVADSRDNSVQITVGG